MPFSLNNKEDSYKNQDYIYGSNIIAFPDSLYVKITFESKGYLNDTIAFDKVIAENDKTSTLTTIVSTAKRHVIRINDIESKRKQYIKESAFKTNELITNKKDIYAISVFANIYLPNNISEDNVSFILTINGIDYNIKPVNSYSDGIKIIRFSQGKMPVEYTKYIGEKITSAYLTVVIKSKNKLTPYINNIKVLMYKDMILKLDYHKKHIIKSFIKRGYFPKSEEIANKLEQVNLRLALFESYNFTPGEKFNVKEINYMIEMLYADITFLYKILEDIQVKEYNKMLLNIETHLTELESLATHYKKRANEEINGTALGKTLLFKTND